MQSQTAHQSSLSEEDVKRRFVPFLKDFYKNRYQSEPGSIQVEMDNVSAEGWVADGKLTFRKPDDTLFVCTYEATSLDKSEEVKYKLNTRYFTWDCVAFGGICAAVSYMLFFQTRLLWLIQLKSIGNIGFLLGLFIIGFSGWYFTMQSWRKYRYIFAIQQFRQYFADEQWVAIAEDVFPAPTDPYYLELRNQCVYNGIGLAIVPLVGNVRKINDPSRLGIYGRDKKMADWVTRAEWYQQVSVNVSAMAARRPKAPDALTALWNKLFRPLHYLLIDPFKKHVLGWLRKPLGETSSAYTRFMSAQTVQKWVAILALAFIAPFFWTVASYKTEEVADLKKLQQWKGGKNPEDERGYIIDGEAIPYNGQPTGVPKQYPVSSKADEDEGPTINLSGDEDEGPTINISGDEADEKPVVKKAAPKKTPKPVVTTPGPCEQLKKSGWIVQESSFSTKDLAAARVAALKKKDIACQYAAQSCLPSGQSSGYLVWIGSVQPTEAAAKKMADTHGRALRTVGLSKGKLFVRQLR
jgi:hypothetical protein